MRVAVVLFLIFWLGIDIGLCVGTNDAAFYGVFPERFRQARQDAGLSIQRLAMASHVHRHTIWRWEQGEYPRRYDLLLRACVALRVPIDNLFPPTDQWRHEG